MDLRAAKDDEMMNELIPSHLLSLNRVKLYQVIQGRFDSHQLFEQNQRERQVGHVVVEQSQSTQDTKQEVTLVFNFWLWTSEHTARRFRQRLSPRQ